MERMLRKKKDNSGYEIDRELTGKFAIEKNAEYQEKIEQLEEENKELKEHKENLIRADKKKSDHIEELEEENKKLKSDLEECECSMHFENDEVGYRKRECKKLKDRVNELIGKIDQLEEENENLSKDLFHLTNNGQRRNPTATQGAEGVIREGGEEQGKNARDS